MASSYKDLEAWKEAMTLAVICKTATAGLTGSDRFLASDMTAKAASISTGLAEGFDAGDPAVMAAAIDEARGRLAATQTYVILSENVGALASGPAKQLLDQCERVGKALRNLGRAKARPGRRP